MGREGRFSRRLIAGPGLVLNQGDGKLTHIRYTDLPVTDPLGDHVNHWATDPYTGERVEEASVIIDGWRVFWCGHTERSDG